MKKILTLGAALLLAASAAAHAQRYSMTATDEPYVPLANPTIITNDFAGKNYAVTIPFEFSPYGVPYDFSVQGHLLVTTYGFIAGRDEANQAGYMVTALMAKMEPRDGSSCLALAVERARGRTALKIEWRNMRLVGNGGDDSMNVQLWLYEKSGDFEVHVGPHHVSGVEAYDGTEGPPVGVAQTNADFSTAYRAFFVSGYDDHLGTDTTIYLYPMSGTPRNGSVYRFQYGTQAAVAEDRLAAGTLLFHPNPANGAVMLSLPEGPADRACRLVLYDELGREARSVEGMGGMMMISTDGLPAGIYHGVVTAGEKRYRVAPLVVRR